MELFFKEKKQGKPNKTGTFETQKQGFFWQLKNKEKKNKERKDREVRILLLRELTSFCSCGEGGAICPPLAAFQTDLECGEGGEVCERWGLAPFKVQKSPIGRRPPPLAAEQNEVSSLNNKTRTFGATL